MKSILFVLLALSNSAHAWAHSTDAPTRQVIQGDLLYRGSAIARTEERALALAEARSAQMLAIECGAVPAETRVYQQQSEALTDGSFTAQVQLGAALADCEALRKLAPEARERHAQSTLSKTVSAFDPLAPRAIQLAPKVAALTQAFVLSDAEEQEALLSRQVRAGRRLAERARLTP